MLRSPGRAFMRGVECLKNKDYLGNASKHLRLFLLPIMWIGVIELTQAPCRATSASSPMARMVMAAASASARAL